MCWKSGSQRFRVTLGFDVFRGNARARWGSGRNAHSGPKMTVQYGLKIRGLAQMQVQDIVRHKPSDAAEEK